MEANQYQAIKQYLLTLEYPRWTKTAGEKTKWRHKCEKIIVIERQLFYKEKKGQLTLVVQQHQIAAILYIVHDHPIGGHRGPGSMSQKICQMYYWETIFENCKRHVQTCRACQFQGKPKKNNELYPIPIGKSWCELEN